ncbi:hypothetical protein G7Z17_g951 [Cylindrodendrum hubeiense]|uniref:LDB19 N-terminal domain-containing protein n=1 Tax=Cylindrodendrum hubeiense TaxID=595255 RepID=A0A9P5HFY1_9HYPO|nr:hypothetical protein G7Z17_g951 [Cylindrodendrum hubeiense]
MSTLGGFLSKPFSKLSRERSSAVSLDWKIDNLSTAVPGSLVSGSVVVNVLEESVEIDSISAVLNSHTTHKQPFRKLCSNCKNQYVKIQDWNFLEKRTVLQRGSHQFPFSVLIEGHLSPTLETPLFTISYEFQADVSLRPKGKSNKESSVITLHRELFVKPSVSGPNLPRHSSYVFPSTGIEVIAHFEPVIRPQDINQVSIKVDGLLSGMGDGETCHIWRLCKAAWSVEENIKTTADACAQHARGINKTEDKSAIRRKVRELGGKDLYECWSSDDEEGTVEMEFNYRLRQEGSLGPRLKYTSDMKSPNGTRVVHSLFLELIFIKEIFPEGRPDLAIRTGTARILSLPYRVLLTDESGVKPHWDEEVPPSYQDVFLHPPTYKEDVQSTILDY